MIIDTEKLKEEICDTDKYNEIFLNNKVLIQFIKTKDLKIVEEMEELFLFLKTGKLKGKNNVNKI